MIINGRFLTQRMSGVQRYARQVTLALDEHLGETAGRAVTLFAPADAICDLSLRHIKFEARGTGPGHLWEQTWLAWRARGEALLSMCNSGPIMHSRQTVVIHDAAIYRHPELYSPAYRAWHGSLGRVLAKTSRIATVSEFSRREIGNVFNIHTSEITLAPNGSEHLLGTPTSPDVIGRLGLEPGKFFVCVGSLSPNKNMGLAVESLGLLGRPDVKLVLCGQADATIFGRCGPTAGRNVILAGSVTDAELRALLKEAAALVFPSRYEGFGIPPLEAFVNECPVLASDAEAVVEVCGDAALHFSPDDATGLSALMAHVLSNDFDRGDAVRRGKLRAHRYSWGETAEALLRELDRS